MRSVFVLRALSLVLGLTGPVAAQEAGMPPALAPLSGPSAPDGSATGAAIPDVDRGAPRREDPGDRVHDGFFLRTYVGGGYLKAKVHTDYVAGGAPPDAVKRLGISGPGVDVALLAGGSPLRGFIVGGALLVHAFSDPSVKARSVEITAEGLSLTQAVIGPFVQFYPDAKGGLFFRGVAGFSALEMEFEGEDQITESRAAGFAGSAAIGYDFWLTRTLSLGPELSFTYARLETVAEIREQERIASETSRLAVPMLSVGMTYN